MALLKDIADGVEAQRKAAYDLDNMVEINYKRGTRVSFKNFTYWGVEAPVMTGTVMWTSVKTSDFSVSIFVMIEVDEQFVPVHSSKVDADGKLITINMLDPVYDITIVA